MKKLHGNVGPEVFRTQLDGSVDPVLGLVETTEVQKVHAMMSGGSGKTWIEGDRFSRPDDGFVESS
jgi:hypothetical protein